MPLLTRKPAACSVASDIWPRGFVAGDRNSRGGDPNGQLPYSFLIAVLFTCSAGAVAQSVSIGSLGTPSGSYGPGPITVIDFAFPASSDGNVTSATFQWSAAP